MHARIRTTAVTSLVAVSLLAGALPASADPVVSEPIAGGLVGPLGLAVGDDGTIYVGEAFSGQLTTIDEKGRTHTLVDQAGSEIAGLDATGKGTVVYTQTLFDGNAGEEAPPLDASLNGVRPNGTTRTIASTMAYEEANNPDADAAYSFQGVDQACLDTIPPEFGIPPPYTGIVESHPYAVAIADDGWYVADAAGNDVVHVDRRGRVSTVAVLPPVANLITEEVLAGFGLPDCLLGATYYGEAVPTDVEIGPDGDLWVTSLPGGPELPGSGSVWRIDPATGDATMVAGGLSSAVDLAVADDGTVYVAELFESRISIVADGSVTPFVEVPLPGAIDIGPDGTLYATILALTEDGAVVTITP
ncbi:ScyD/ScyE family protein [Salsipaludibacter albus]|uniref:ScyD/ScyE family protein n=1 Tax=Salsipaludibacter albus TaxID=2849650 RepID=UPI001EE3EBF7|nr:ScyD/ScyE family protein [Salsipaludibacter albus]MBY5162427.1 ScyD/ScyE family protein [Salsipaludibacter albus]